MSSTWGRKSLKPRPPLDEDGLYTYAIGALARRMKTVAELKRLMQLRVETGEEGEAKMLAVIARLQENNYLNDTTYASDYTRMRQENEKFGKRRVQQELARKGVNQEIVTATIQVAYDPISEEELARQHLARKRIQQPADPRASARLVRQLVRAGFSTGVIFKILKSWQANDETLAAVETLDIDEEAGSQ